jgi:UDP-N-acetylmuramoyl-tripeptide--D-alanyl-D-alanine ligase
MKELGAFSSEGHRYVGEIVKQREVEFLITVGEIAQEIAEEATHLPASKKHHFTDAEAACQSVQDFIEPHDIVLVKGSRAMQMEKIVEVLKAKNEN